MRGSGRCQGQYDSFCTPVSLAFSWGDNILASYQPEAYQISCFPPMTFLDLDPFAPLNKEQEIAGICFMFVGRHRLFQYKQGFLTNVTYRTGCKMKCALALILYVHL
jgi:hypothetical protein